MGEGRITETVEVVVAAMHQTDFSLVEKMNIRTNAIFANQCDKNEYTEIETRYGTVKMVSTTTRGVGLNRNIGLDYASGEILLFTDEDMVYQDDMPERVLQAYKELNKADVIIFGTQFSKNNQIYFERKVETKRLPLYQSLKFGTCAIAVRRSALLANDIRFTTLFGGGCIYSHGEDSDFILQCYRKRLHVYTYDYNLGYTKKDESTCFEGYTPKYFYDSGALANHSMGLLKWPYMIRHSIKTPSDTGLNFWGKMQESVHGMLGEKKQISYEKWRQNHTLAI